MVPRTPVNLYEYQKKGLTKFAFRNRLILKDAILLVWRERALISRRKEKSDSKAVAVQMWIFLKGIVPKG